MASVAFAASPAPPSTKGTSMRGPNSSSDEDNDDGEPPRVAAHQGSSQSELDDAIAEAFADLQDCYSDLNLKNAIAAGSNTALRACHGVQEVRRELDKAIHELGCTSRQELERLGYGAIASKDVEIQELRRLSAMLKFLAFEYEDLDRRRCSITADYARVRADYQPVIFTKGSSSPLVTRGGGVVSPDVQSRDEGQASGLEATVLEDRQGETDSRSSNNLVHGLDIDDLEESHVRLSAHGSLKDTHASRMEFEVLVQWLKRLQHVKKVASLAVAEAIRARDLHLSAPKPLQRAPRGQQPHSTDQRGPQPSGDTSVAEDVSPRSAELHPTCPIGKVSQVREKLNLKLRAQKPRPKPAQETTTPAASSQKDKTDGPNERACKQWYWTFHRVRSGSNQPYIVHQAQLAAESRPLGGPIAEKLRGLFEQGPSIDARRWRAASSSSGVAQHFTNQDFTGTRPQPQPLLIEGMALPAPPDSEI